jgi:glutaconate CoA-transferase, subunit A
MLMALQAGASGLPFTPVPGLIGSDLMRVRPDFREIPDPYDPAMRVAVVPAITPDVAIVHALGAARDGTLIIPASGDAHLLIQASRFVIATAEEVWDAPPAQISADERLIPGIYVDLIAPAPYGAHPLRCGGLYGDDAAQIREYVDAARDGDRFRWYLQEYVLGPRDHTAYIERILQPAGVP